MASNINRTFLSAFCFYDIEPEALVDFQRRGSASSASGSVCFKKSEGI